MTLGARDFFWLELTRPGAQEPAPVEGIEAADKSDEVPPPTSVVSENA